MQKLNINVSKIDKTALFKGKQGSYLDLTLIENRDGEDQYGNDGLIVQDIGKERREAGEKGPILGNWKHLRAKNDQAPPPKKTTAAGGPVSDASDKFDDDDDIPF